MPWSELPGPERMERVAVVAPMERLRAVLTAVAASGTVEIDLPAGPGAGGRAPAGIDQVGRQMVVDGPVAAITGWCPALEVPGVRQALAPQGGALVRLPPPRWVVPPTLIKSRGVTRSFQPLVDTYGTLPYRDVNPAGVAGLAYVVMFGMMFGDVGHGLLLLVAGILLRSGRPARLTSLRRLAPFVLGCGVTSTLFGLAYGEAFGPTGLVPVVWVRPLDHATMLLAVAVAAGGGLLALSYGLGTVNRWRELGAWSALMHMSGAAGAALYAGLAVVGAGVWLHHPGLVIAGAVTGGGGFLLGFAGSFAATTGGGAGALQASIEMLDSTLRMGANTVSFARLAAFGLTHAALGDVIWRGTSALWGRGAGLWVVAALLFLAGNAAAFSLEALVAGVQALRLEYYEIFSRLFATEGRPFRPWHIPTADSATAGEAPAAHDSAEQEASCSPG